MAEDLPETFEALEDSFVGVISNSTIDKPEKRSLFNV